jgi:hypothetical protein
MATAIYPLELPVTASHPRLTEFCSMFRCQGELMEVPLAARLLPSENCYWNVLCMIEDHGGELLFGWMIKHWPGLYLAAEHHAVWRCPGGQLLDVTQRRPEAAAPTTFALDSVQDFDTKASPNGYKALVKKGIEIRVEIGDQIDSLLSRPPNHIARAAAREFCDHQRCIA